MKKIGGILFNIICLAIVVLVLAKKIPVWMDHFHNEGMAAKPFRVQNLAGDIVSLPLKDQKPAVLIFWATWCGPCHYQMVQIQESINKKEIPADRVFAIDLGESRTEVADFVKKQNYTFPIFLDSENDVGRVYDIQGTPTLIHINSDGSIRWMTAGVNPMNGSKMKDLLGNL